MTTYQQLFDCAPTFPMFPVYGTPQEQEAFSIKHANSIIKIRAMNNAYKEYKDSKGTKRITGIVQEYIPKVAVKCQAVNLNNSPCKFKAISCGKFCKKHQVSAEMLALIE